MSGSRTYSVGIDPGLGEAGIVLVEHTGGRDTVVEYGLVRDNYGTGFPTALRAQAVAVRLIEQLQLWVDRHQIADLAAAVEQPIYNANAAAFGKQIATYQAIVAALLEYVGPMVAALTVAEPIPSESKHLATGSGAASKAEVFKASPFNVMLGKPQPIGGIDLAAANLALPDHTLHTLGDAWSHSLAARGGCKTKWDAKQMTWPRPRPAGGIE